MANKTAMRHLYDEMEELNKVSPFIAITDILRSIGHFYLEEEKKQIIQAYDEANFPIELREYPNGENYYETTYQDT